MKLIPTLLLSGLLVLGACAQQPGSQESPEVSEGVRLEALEAQANGYQTAIDAFDAAEAPDDLAPIGDGKTPLSPLVETVKGLFKVADGLEEIDDVPTLEESLRVKLRALTARVSKLISRGILAPVKKIDEAIEEHGFDVVEIDDLTHKKLLQPNLKLQSMRLGAYALQSQMWTELGELLLQRSRAGMLAFVLSNQAGPNFSPVDKFEVVSKAIPIGDSLKTVRSSVVNTLMCINDIGRSYEETGLKPVAVSAREIKLSEADLNRKYRVNNLADIAADQKVLVRSRLEQLIIQGNKYRGECISDMTLSFLEGQLKMLK